MWWSSSARRGGEDNDPGRVTGLPGPKGAGKTTTRPKGERGGQDDTLSGITLAGR